MGSKSVGWKGVGWKGMGGIGDGIEDGIRGIHRGWKLGVNQTNSGFIQGDCDLV